MSDTQHDPIEALLDDFIARLRNGETPSIAEYEAAHPEFAEEVRQTFPAVQMIEQAALRRDQQRPSTKADRPPERLGDFKIIRIDHRFVKIDSLDLGFDQIRLFILITLRRDCGHRHQCNQK